MDYVIFIERLAVIFIERLATSSPDVWSMKIFMNYMVCIKPHHFLN